MTNWSIPRNSSGVLMTAKQAESVYGHEVMNPLLNRAAKFTLECKK